MPFNASVVIPKFRGLANNLPTTELTAEYLRRSPNFILDDKGLPHIRPGYELIDDVSYFHVTKNKHHGYIIRGTELYILNVADDSFLKIGDIEGGAPYYFTDAGDSTFFCTSTNTYCIIGGTLRPWGVPLPPVSFSGTITNGAGKLYAGKYRIALAYVNKYGAISGCSKPVEFAAAKNSGIRLTNLPINNDYRLLILASKVDGSTLYYHGVVNTATFTIVDIDHIVNREFIYTNSFPPPIGGPICYHNGRNYISVYDANQHYSEVYGSINHALHHFKLLGDVDYAQQGKVNLLASSSKGLIIGTDFEIVLQTDDGKREVLANYGAKPGCSFDYDDVGLLYIVTDHGIRVIGGDPFFKDPLDGRFITDWGESCGGGFIRHKGTSLFIAVPFSNSFQLSTKW